MNTDCKNESEDLVENKNEEPVKNEDEITELDKKIIRQVEYYFGDFNLRKDKFLREEVKKDDGWVLLETLLTFQRLKALTGDRKTICDALKKSTNELMEVDEDYTKIRRRLDKPVPDSMNNDALTERTLYVKGFKRTTTLDELIEFFQDHKAENIQMRRVFKKEIPKDQKAISTFKGSVFVVFNTKEDAEKFLEIKGIKFEGTELLKEKKKDYVARKDVFYQNLRAEKAQKSSKNSEEKGKSGGPAINIVSGALLKLSGIKDLNREDIKEALREFGTVAYVDFNRGDTEAVVRFETGEAALVFDKAGHKEEEKVTLEINECTLVLSLVEGEEEKEYWNKIRVGRADRMSRHHQGGQGRFNKGRFNKKPWGKRGNRREDNKDQPPSKKARTEIGENKAKEVAC